MSILRTCCTIRSRSLKIRTKQLSLISCLALFLLLAGACSQVRYDVSPDDALSFHSLRIKVNVKFLETKDRGNFKIILKYDGSRDKMLFLSPMNQVYGYLVVEKERVLLVNTKKKRFWRGPFYLLLQEIWGPGMDFDYSEFKQLLVEGAVPKTKTWRHQITIDVTHTDEAGKPHHLEIASPDVKVKIRVSGRKTGKGKIRFETGTTGLQRTPIREVLE